MHEQKACIQVIIFAATTLEFSRWVDLSTDQQAVLFDASTNLKNKKIFIIITCIMLHVPVDVSSRSISLAPSFQLAGGAPWFTTTTPTTRTP